MLHAEAVQARKSQVSGTNRSLKSCDRAKMKQRTSLTSHNAKNGRSEPFSVDRS
jgi:hypothetical protein